MSESLFQAEQTFTGQICRMLYTDLKNQMMFIHKNAFLREHKSSIYIVSMIAKIYTGI